VGKASKPSLDWLRDHLTAISESGEEAVANSPDTFNEYGYHSGLKLAALRHALDVFTPVAHSRVVSGHFDRAVYVDLFAGAGVVRTPFGDHLAGSPLIASASKRPFDQYILIERDSQRAAALCGRLPKDCLSKATVIPGDCNQVIDQVVKALDGNPIVFVVIDPEGLDIKWSTVEMLGSTHEAIDFFVNVPHGADREVAAAEAMGRSSPKTEDLTGLPFTEVLKRVEQGGVSSVYAGQLDGVLGKAIGTRMPIRDDHSRPTYELLMYTRRTWAGSGFAAGYKALGARLKDVDAKDVEALMHQIRGRQARMSQEW
jgi:three-Cys-motif partner protein